MSPWQTGCMTNTWFSPGEKVNTSAVCCGVRFIRYGSYINVLPYRLGLELGAIGEPQGQSLRLSGNLAQCEARPLIVSGVFSSFAPVRLVFAWTRAENIPLILGQVNFFMEFDVCFYRSQQAFERRPKSP